MFDLSQFKTIILDIIPNDIKRLRQYLLEEKQGIYNEIGSVQNLLDEKINQRVVKGNNGTWGDSVAVSTDLHQPQRLTFYEPSTKNKPSGSSYGTAVSYSNQGHFRKASQNWITTLAFSTDQKVFLTQSINGGQDGWLAIPTATFACHTSKLSSTLPALGGSVVIPFSVNNRNAIVDVSVRVDLANSSLILKDNVEIIINERSQVTGLKITNNTNNSLTNNRPMTIYVSIER